MTPGGPCLVQQVEALTGTAPESVTPLAGGCIAEVYKVTLPDGSALVAKLAPEGGLAEEARMLADLAHLSDLPLPAVRYAADDLLLLDYVETSGRLDRSCQVDTADRIAALHEITGPAYGYGRDTLIGPLRQPNPWSDRWCDFFRDHRLLYMARLARDSGNLPAETMKRLEHLAAKIERYLEEPAAPSLLHGDLWDGNILVSTHDHG